MPSGSLRIASRQLPQQPACVGRVDLLKHLDGSRLEHFIQLLYQLFLKKRHGPVARVEVSTNGGATWSDARLGTLISPAAWREWSIGWTPERGTHEVIARAMDAAGEAQVLQERRDPLGYENNAAQPARIVAV